MLNGFAKEETEELEEFTRSGSIFHNVPSKQEKLGGEFECIGGLGQAELSTPEFVPSKPEKL